MLSLHVLSHFATISYLAQKPNPIDSIPGIHEHIAIIGMSLYESINLFDILLFLPLAFTFRRIFSLVILCALHVLPSLAFR